MLDDASWPTLAEARASSRDQFDGEYTEKTLARAGGNVTRAAQLAGVGRQFMTKLVARYRLRARDLREPDDSR